MASHAVHRLEVVARSAAVGLMLVVAQAAAGQPASRPILRRMRRDTEVGTAPGQHSWVGDHRVAIARGRAAWRFLAFASVASAAGVFVLEIIGELVLGSERVAIDYRTYIPDLLRCSVSGGHG